jgi:serine/threonine-protein kinase RsbW
MRTRVTAAREPAVDVRFCLLFPREAISVPVVRRVLGDMLETLGVDHECICDLLLAVTEACTNVLRHSGPGPEYEVAATVGPNRCVLEVVDSGQGFDPARLSHHRAAIRSVPGLKRRRRIAKPDWPYPASALPAAARGRLSRGRAQARALARLPESGRGLAIMRACVDDVTLSSRPGHGTVVSLRKRIELRSDAPLARHQPLRDHGDAVQLRDAG